MWKSNWTYLFPIWKVISCFLESNKYIMHATFPKCTVNKWSLIRSRRNIDGCKNADVIYSIKVSLVYQIYNRRVYIERGIFTKRRFLWDDCIQIYSETSDKIRLKIRLKMFQWSERKFPNTSFLLKKQLFNTNRETRAYNQSIHP